MTDQELDTLMSRLLLDSEERAFHDKINEPPPFQPSRRHEREMRRMLKDPLAWADRRTRRMARPRWVAVLQQAAVFILILFLGAGVLLAFSPEARAMVTQWFVQWDEGHILRYQYDGPALARLMPPYSVTALPDGFTEAKRDEFFTASFVVYENPDGCALYFEYGQIAQGAQVRRKRETMRNDLLNTVPVRVGETEGQFIPAQEAGGDNTLLWYDAEEGIQFALAGPWKQEDMVNMAESVSLVKTTK